MTKRISAIIPAVLLMAVVTSQLRAQSRLIDIGGRKIEIMRVGQGTQTVVFDAGLGFGLDTWSGILTKVGEFATAISYSRAGMQKSDPAPTPRTLDNIVEDLRITLKNAGLQPPYILVGHSIGGMYMRYYATKFPGEVAGLVLVDGSHERQRLEFAKASGVTPPVPAPDPKVPSTLEVAGWSSIMDAGSFGPEAKLPDVPMAILTSLRVASQNDNPDRREVWRSLHSELFGPATYAMHIVTSRSGHFIHRDEPQLVVNAIRYVVDAAAKR